MAALVPTVPPRRRPPRRPRRPGSRLTPTRATVTGTPLSAALPETSRRSGSVRSLIDTPATFDGAAHPGAVGRVAVAVGEATRRRASCRRSPGTSTLDRADPRPHAAPRAVGDAALGQVVGVHQQLVARAAPGQPLGVVHPGVVVLLVPPADQQQLRPARPARRRRRPSRRRSSITRPGARSIRLSLVCRRSGMRRPQRAEVDALGVLAQLPPSTPSRPAAQQRRDQQPSG